MTLRRAVFYFVSLLVVAVALWSIALAQGGALLDAEDKALADKIDAATAEIAKLTEETAALGAELSGQETVNAEQEIRLRGLQTFFEELSASVAALKESGSLPQPPEPVEPSPSPGPAPGVVFPNTDDGKPVTQLGLFAVCYWCPEDQFLNLFKTHDVEWTAEGGPSTAPLMEPPALWKAGLIDKTTMVPTKVPTGYRFIRSSLYRNSGKAYPDYYAGTYVFDWEGEPGTEAKCGGTTRKISANRIECDFPPNTGAGRIELYKIGPGFKNLRLYRIENEAALNRGEVFDPKWLAHVGRYKIIRTMDIEDSNGSWVRSVDELTNKSSLHWGVRQSWNAKATEAGLPRGYPVEALFDMAVASDTALWMTVPGILGAPDVFVDPVEMANLNAWQTGQAWVRAKAKEHAQAIIASPEWRKYADEIVRSLIASGYKTNYTLYVELWNEVWNTGGGFWRMTYYNTGLAEGIGGVEAFASRYGYGYMTAHFAVHFAEALKAKGRTQEWVSVLAGQNANPETTRAALLGFKRYFKDHPEIDSAPYLKRLGVSAASYYGGVFDRGTVIDGLSDDEYKTNFLSRIASDPQGLKTALTKHILEGPASKVGTLAFIIAKRAEHQRMAEAAGAFYVSDYEGGDHSTLPGIVANDPIVKAFVHSWRYGPDGERITKAWADALIAQNPKAGLANYYSIGQPTPASPWLDGGPGEETGITRGLAPYLRN
jgi:hypothetical protein